ncbi:MAG: RNA chaperone Hfq [Rhodobacteraceae bacterium]|nr:RNA chaperone Hfq [Paracoccaceae bacterium]
MTSARHDLQNAFLNHMRKNKLHATLFLISGVKLQGRITRFDNFTLVLRRDGQSQLVYKHAIATIMPAQPIHLPEDWQESDTPDDTPSDTPSDNPEEAF